MDDRSLDPMIAQARSSVTRAKDALLKTFAFVPDDRLAWSPSPTARTPLWVVGHCGAANVALAAILRGEPLPVPADPAEAIALIRAAGRDTSTRAQAVQSIEDSSAAVLAALDSITPDRLETVPDSPFGPMPFAAWMQIPSMHMAGHAYQIDYLETIWGDIQDH